ncbi:MAG: DUF115 domain-containing protein [Opitutales bacterium]|nr:DUF115 domain-containing protein [Opitutales bacterium]
MKKTFQEKWLLQQKKAEATSCFLVGAIEEHSTLSEFSEYNHVVWFVEEEKLPSESTLYQNVYPMTLETVDKSNVDEIIQMLSDENMVHTPDIFCTEHILENYSVSYEYIIQRIQIFLENKKRGVNTHMFHGFISQRKVISNIPNFIKNKFSDNFENSIEGVPAAIIGAGPSLDVSIRLLEKYHKKMLIFCTDSAVKSLSKANIDPDAIITVDVTKLPENYLEENRAVKSLFLSLKSPQEWVDKSESNTHFLSGSNLADSFLELNGISATKCKIVGNCGVTALNISMFLGCSPIILFGMDHAVDDSGKRWTGDLAEREARMSSHIHDTTVEGNYTSNIKCGVSHELEVFKQVASRTSPNQEIWNINDRGAKVDNAKLIHPDNFTFDFENLSKDKNLFLKSDSSDQKAIKKIMGILSKCLKKNKSIIKKLKSNKKIEDEELCLHLANLFKDKNIFKICGNFSLKISPLIIKWDELPASLKHTLRLETKEIIEDIQTLHTSLLETSK